MNYRNLQKWCTNRAKSSKGIEYYLYEESATSRFSKGAIFLVDWCLHTLTIRCGNTLLEAIVPFNNDGQTVTFYSKKYSTLTPIPPRILKQEAEIHDSNYTAINVFRANEIAFLWADGKKYKTLPYAEFYETIYEWKENNSHP